MVVDEVMRSSGQIRELCGRDVNAKLPVKCRKHLLKVDRT